MTASTTGASAGSGGRSAHGIISKARSEDGIRRIFNDFPEQQAICAFFLDFVLLPRHPGSVQGHLEHLLPLYQKTTPDSPLSLATSSVALVLSGSPQKRKDDRQLARKIFSKALQKVNAAIRNPTESKKDETLMAVLLLGLFEVSQLEFCPHSRSPRPFFLQSHSSSRHDPFPYMCFTIISLH